MKRTERLLSWIGDSTTCKGCGTKIYWIITKNKKPMPVDPDGEPHFATCPKAADFRKEKNERDN